MVTVPGSLIFASSGACLRVAVCFHSIPASAHFTGKETEADALGESLGLRGREWPCIVVRIVLHLARYSLEM